MPRISAATVAEHRAIIQNKLVDAAEEILRSGEPEKLTAATVAQAAGIARNSIYRYVDSVDDLHGMVLARSLPGWLEAVDAALADVEDPTERIVVWTAANLRESARTGHGWLMMLGRTDVSPASEAIMEQAHKVMRDALASAWGALLPDPTAARIAGGLTRGVLEAGFRQLDAGEPIDAVVAVSTNAVRGIVAGLTTHHA
ncbi:TetR/AcrR family transcriptional regulator [Tessaracoccus terricola]